VVDRHIAPHALELAARWAVLTRLEPPDPDRYPPAAQQLVRDLTPVDKLALYDQHKAPERLTTREARDLRGVVGDLFDERRDLPEYEGRFGASAREIRGALMNAAQDPHYRCLSPLAVLDQLRQLCREKTLYDYLRREAKSGYRDSATFVDDVENQYLDTIDEEVCVSMGLVAESSYQELFSRYVRHLSAWVKGEKVAHPVSGELMDPDATLMTEIEEILLSSGEQRDDFRNSVISQIGAFALDHPGEAPPYGEIFPGYLRKLQDDFFNKRRKQVQRAKEDLLKVIHGETTGLDAKALKRLQGMLETMRQRYGYCEHCANDMVAFLMKKRYAD
jgi:predicted Ser/Thr protein kinase